MGSELFARPLIFGPEMFSEYENLLPFNTFGITAKARHFARFSSAAELIDQLKTAEVLRGPMMVIGGGSNLLFTRDFPGVILKNEIGGIHTIEENDKSVLIQAGAGEVWHQLVLYTIGVNAGGIENLSLIPGSVGAAPMQNIGAYGVEIKDVFQELSALEIATGKIRTFSAAECRFGYRESIFKNELKGQYIILDVTLKLSRSPEVNTSYGAIEQQLKAMGITNPGIRDVSDAVISIRRSKLPDPAIIGNAGSFFKNPLVPKSQFDTLRTKYRDVVGYPAGEHSIKLAAGWLIEKAGWKGKTLGNFGVHKDQALVLVNYGGAQGNQIYELSEQIVQSVRQKFDVELEREVNLVG